MVLLTELPPEIVQHVLGYVDPPDLAWIPRICRSFYHTIKGNSSLFRIVYLNNLDKPPSKSVIDWEKAIKDTVRLEAICRRETVEEKKSELSFVYETVRFLLQNAATDTERVRSMTYPSSRNAEILSDIFSKPTTKAAFLCRSFTYERVYAEVNDSLPDYYYRHRQPIYQMSAHLHCLYGVPILHIPDYPRSNRCGKARPFACSKVYDLRQYTDKTKWGPFRNDDTGRVDWEMVEAVMIVLASNIRKMNLNRLPVCRNFWETPFAGTWSQSYKPLPLAREPDPVELQDPYGVTGTWLRVVCFIDYTDFYAYNFTAGNRLPPNAPRDPIDIGEATRLMLMKMRVTKIEPPGPEDGQELPIVHFKGISRTLDDTFDENANSDLRGSVRLTKEGEVRWTTFSIIGGVERWRSEGIQVGGVRSAKGVMGNWFDTDYSPEGPAGPSGFWKVSDRAAESGGYKALMQDFLPLIQDQLDETHDEYDAGNFEDAEEEYEEEYDVNEEDEDDEDHEIEITGISWVMWSNE